MPDAAHGWGVDPDDDQINAVYTSEEGGLPSGDSNAIDALMELLHL